jgi:hypothetical protein
LIRLEKRAISTRPGDDATRVDTANGAAFLAALSS